jgi:AcrR family transcriptional regulator
MPRSVKRSYDASARQARSADTRQRIVDAAGTLFREHGYRATTVAALADAAGVNVDTVYALVGRKPELLRELIEQAISGTDRAVPAEERPHIVALRAEPDPARKLEIYAQAIAETQPRLAPLVRAVREAGAEPEVRDLWQEISDRRAVNMRRLIADLAAVDGLRPELDPEDAADTVWALNSPELFAMLTGERGWTTERYGRWLATTLVRILVE